ncbi:hypothetical protein Msil_1829 [Methylocella silvestris BL2]|uniref:Uncharacterized protein n=1 Tax=Methylocella silvestris (strain DSM 15510 / CIP 108128 / LMG 27833 / NCIMB 13906 / BL2) TaxID=395965 RepID=B8ELZ3_METSB|nr:hypothetical protein [Methylocella silvestris]ACK50774.1 hypothetical protein Msil_1829 [Methylocella silvestris BL2]
MGISMISIIRNGRAARAVAVAAALMASAGAASAASPHAKAAAQDYYGMYQGQLAAQPSPGADAMQYDHAGTRGRDGAGVSPFRPEGPGNFSD